MMYEKEGSCPGICFEKFAMEIKKQGRAEKLFHMIGDRKSYMVYDKGMETYGSTWPSVVELLLDDVQSEQIAFLLQVMIPECKYAEKGKKILIRDVLSPLNIPGVYHLQGTKFSFMNEDGCLNVYHSVKSEKDGKRVLFYSQKFVSVVEDEGERIVIWIFKYPPIAVSSKGL